MAAGVAEDPEKDAHRRAFISARSLQQISPQPELEEATTELLPNSVPQTPTPRVCKMAFMARPMALRFAGVSSSRSHQRTGSSPSS